MSVNEKMTTICNQIRNKTGVTDLLNLDAMAEQIRSITPVKDFMWKDKEPTYCEPKAQEAIDVARSYWIARAKGRVFKYSDGYTFLNGANVNDGNGYGLIDCSTYIHLILRGIRYEDSPYADETPNVAFNPNDLITNTSYSWADDKIKLSETIGGMVRYASDFAAYLWMQGRCFTDSSKVKTGDITFHSNGINGKFMNIAHVGIVEEDITNMFNIRELYDNGTPTTVVRTALADCEDIVFYGRPDYEQIENIVYGFNPDFNYLSSPWFNTSTVINGVNVAVDEEIDTLTTDGSSTGSTIINLISSSYSLYLPSGTYKLTGTPPRTDRGSRLDYSYWGLRLYPSDERDIVAKVWGYDSDDYSNQDPTTTYAEQTGSVVWEKGYGAEFTIDTGMLFYANIYISQYVASDDLVYTGTDIWKPCLKRIG